jgi:glucan-binding YG repeat protein
MHKKIKHIIAVTLVVGTISGALPVNNFIFGDIVAHAASYSEAGNGELSSLNLTRSTGSVIELRDSYSGNEISTLTGQKDYYAELDGSDGLQISAQVQGSGYVVKQFTSADKTAKGEDVGNYVNIDSTYEDIYLRTYKSEDAYKEAYGDGDVTNCEHTYIIHVEKPAVTSDTELDKEYAYLQSIYLSNGDINFSKNQYSYNINVNDNVGEILVRATPEDSDDVVEINGQSVEESDNFEKTISLNKGNNAVTIDVKSNDDEETYTLNVYRGNTSASTTSTSQTSTSNASTSTDSTNQTSTSLVSSGDGNLTIQNDTKKFNAWQRIDGKLKYIDGTGEALKNQWWFDVNTGNNYYLKEDGTAATGWLYNNNNWYYFNAGGEMQTGWVCLDKNWYYLNKSGAMQMGWLEDSSGNWYYLDSNGAMKTGWTEDSDGKWYYLDSTGKMIKDTTAIAQN